jgi:putative acetyltransferase
MIAIDSLAESGPDLPLARDLFGAYAAFLHRIAACHSFNFARFEAEILDLPRPYTEANGDLLLARIHPDPTPIGCIAFRAAKEPTATELFGAQTTCELKRLFVRPTHRGQGIAERLVVIALTRAAARGFRTAILDTEPSTMQPALSLYRKLGFTPFQPERSTNPVDVLYLRRNLP